MIEKDKAVEQSSTAGAAKGGSTNEKSAVVSPLTAPAPLTDEQIFNAMKPDLDKGDGGYLCDMFPAGVIAAGRAIEREVVKAAPAAPVQTAVPVPRATLLMIYDAMNHMGDILNNMDACEEEDEEATTPAFDAIRELLDDSYLIAPSTGESKGDAV